MAGDIKRNALLAVAAAVAAGVIIFAGLRHLGPPGAPSDLPGLEGIGAGVERLEEDCGAALEKSTGFDQERVLKSLGRSGFNGAFFRLDDNIGQARAVAVPDAPAGKRGLRYSFPGSGSEQFRLNMGTWTLEDGCIRVGTEKGQVLYGPAAGSPLGIEKGWVDSIVISASHVQGTGMYVILNGDFGDGKPGGTSRRFVINTVPDGEFHTYVFDVKLLLRYDTTLDIDKIDSVGIELSNKPDDDVRIGFIDVILKKDEYLTRKWGVSTESAGDDLRPVVFCVSGTELSYSMTLPESTAYFDAGIASAVGGEQVDFELSVDGGNGPEVLFRKTSSSDDRWGHVRADLGGYAGRRVDLRLKTSGAPEGVGLWSNPVVMTRRNKPLNVIVYVEDALRADHLSLYGYGKETSPVKEEFARSGVVFSRALSQSTHTRNSTASLMTGLYPTATGVWLRGDSLSGRYLTLAEILRSQGFRTAAVVQNPHAGSRSGLHQGFCQMVQGDGAGERVRELYDSFLFGWLDDNRDENFFLYVHAIDPHGPYEPEPPFDDWYKEQRARGGRRVEPWHLEPDWLKDPTAEDRIARYDGEILENDTQFGRLVEKLRDLGIFEDTLIVFTSDHGEHLDEHGLWNHIPPSFDCVTHIPMVMTYPREIPAGQVVPYGVQSIDVMPTILEYCGINTRALMLEGRSLAPLLVGDGGSGWDDRVTISDEVLFRKDKGDARPLGSLHYGDYHYISTYYLKGNTLTTPDSDVLPKDDSLLYNLADDPTEQKDIEDSTAESRMRGYITDVQKINLDIMRNMGGAEPGTVSIDPAVEERLKALGYVQ